MSTKTHTVDYVPTAIDKTGDESFTAMERDLMLMDMDQRRYEIARDVARMLIARDGLVALDVDRIAWRSVKFADALIARLQRPTAGTEELGE